jgi:threonine/homoserine/homoserine lactone efflux protein
MDILKAFLFGFTLAISVGPIAILIINQSINFGLLNGVKCGMGAALADYFYAFVSFIGGHLIFNLLQNHKNVITLVSSLVLIAFGLWMVYQAWRKLKNVEMQSRISSTVLSTRPFATTFALTIVNPLTVVVFMGLSGQYQNLTMTKVALVATAVFLGSLVVQLLLALFGSQMAILLKNNKVLVYMNIISGLAIMGFGVMKFL